MPGRLRRKPNFFPHRRQQLFRRPDALWDRVWAIRTAHGLVQRYMDDTHPNQVSSQSSKRSGPVQGN